MKQQGKLQEDLDAIKLVTWLMQSALVNGINVIAT
jgi:hypothetical protein